MKQNCDGEIAFVDTYFKTKHGPSGTVVNHGTWDSAVEAVHNWSQLQAIRSQLFGQFYKKQWPQFKHRNYQKYLPHTPEDIGWLTVPFWDTDKFVARRTQLHNYIVHNERPIQVAAYLVVGSWLMVFGLGLMGLMFGTLATFTFGRKWLRDYPHVFSCGVVTKTGPTRQQVRESSFQMTLIGRGWSDQLASPTDEPEEPPKKIIEVKVSGPEAAYDATAIFMVQSAVVILQETDRIPFAGGVITPGMAFRNTSLVDRLRRHSISFDVVKRT